MIDPLRFAFAAVPLAAYFLLIGAVNRRSRPLLVSGANDLATLGAALVGVAFVGPIELFRPDGATGQLGNAIWFFLLTFYGLWVALLVMLGRPRLVVYNATAAEVRPALAEAIEQIDPSARWAGDSLLLPRLGVQLHLDSQPWMRTTSLVASGGDQQLAGWRRLKLALERTLRAVEVPPSPRGGVFFTCGVLLLVWTTFWLVSDSESVALAWGELTSFGD